MIMEAEINHEAIVEEMKAAGFREFKPNKVANSHATNAYQKRYEDKRGTKYFITCYEYDWTMFPDHGRPYPKSWEFDGQFELRDGRTFNFQTVGWFFFPTEWGHKVCTLEDVENFFENMWKNLSCKHYAKNEAL